MLNDDDNNDDDDLYHCHRYAPEPSNNFIHFSIFCYCCFGIVGAVTNADCGWNWQYMYTYIFFIYVCVSTGLNNLSLGS